MIPTATRAPEPVGPAPEPTSAVAAATSPVPPRPTRRRTRSLAVHLLALVVVVLGVTAAVGTHGRYSGDEGAVAITARSLASGHGWMTPNPNPRVDPKGAEYPIELSVWGTRGTSAYAKHPAFPAVLAAADRVAGMAGMVGLSALGTVLAALAAALIARRIDPTLTLPTLWLVGVASPLLFDSQLLMAHTLAAAAAAFGALAAEAAWRARGRRSVGFVLLAGLAVAAMALLRTEGLFLGGAMGLALASLAPRGQRVRGVVLGGAVAGAAGVAYVVDHLAVRQVMGRLLGDPSTVQGGAVGLVAGRFDALRQTVLAPGYDRGLPPLLLLVMVAVLAAAVVAVVRGGERHRRQAGLFALAAGGLALVRAVLAPDAVPGLLVAWPFLWAGLALAGRRPLRDPLQRFLLASSGVFALAVLATQYAIGGGVEWGGRYFALAVPLVAPVAMVGLRDGARRLGGIDRRRATAGALAVAVGLSVLAVRELRSTESTTKEFVGRVAAVASRTGDRPVIVTTSALLPRASWDTFAHQRWLLADPEHPADLVARLRRAGVDRFTFVTSDPAGEAAVVAGATRVRTTVVDGWSIESLQT